MTAASIPPELSARLIGAGMTSRYLAEQLGITRHAAVLLLQAAGAVTDKHSLYHMPGTRAPFGAQKMLARRVET